MKNTPKDQFTLDFNKSHETPTLNETPKRDTTLSLVYSKAQEHNTKITLSTREKILDDVLQYARSLKW